MLRRILILKNFNSLLNIRSINNASVTFNKDINQSETSTLLLSNPKPLQEVTEMSDLLKGIAIIPKDDLKPEHLTRIFSKLFEIYKNDLEQSSMDIIRSNGFKIAVNHLKFHAPRMMANDLVICLKTLVSLKLNSHHKIVQQLLYHIKEEINDLSLSQLVFLNYLLSKMDSTPLSNALRIAIPIVFDLNVSLKLDHENPEELLKLLHYVSVTNMKISDKSMMNLISALALHGTNLSVYIAQIILSSIKKLPYKYFDTYDVLPKLVQNCIHVLNIKFEESTFPKMEDILEKLIVKYKYSNIDAFYNETFFNTCVRHLIEQNLGYTTAFHVARKLNEINFVNYDLLGYIDEKIIQNHTSLSTMHLNQLMILMSVFSTADYKSDNWEIIKSILHENPVFQSDNLSLDLPHLKFICDLLSLNFVSKIYFDKVLDENFLVEYFKRNSSKNFANFPQIRLINQALRVLHPEYDGILPDKIFLDLANDAIPSETNEMNQSLKNMLEEIFGIGTVQMNVLTRYGHLIDFVVSFDNQKKAINLPCKVQYFEDIPKSQVQSVAVFFHSRKNSPINLPMKLRGIIQLRKRTLEVLGIKEADIALHCLELLHDVEKLDYVEREVRNSLL